MKRYRTTLIIAGSDSCGGAGIQADIKTCSALGVYATTAITAITAQNTVGVKQIEAVSPMMVRRQIEAVLEDFTVDSIKIGMLCNAAIAHEVAATLSGSTIPIILDPVMVSTSGCQLLSNDAIEVIVKELFPLASIITPNIHEASLLTGVAINTPHDIATSAQFLLSHHCRAVLMKGGHFTTDPEATDRLFLHNGTSHTFTSPFITTRNTHGTGCTLSSAIAAYMARGCDMTHAVREAKMYLSQAIDISADVTAGKGHGSLNHLYNPQPLSAIKF